MGIGGIVRMNAFDGSKREVYARGMRNSVGMDFNPKDSTLWFTDNQTDGMGDDIAARRDQSRDQGRASTSATRGSAGARCGSPSTATTRTRCRQAIADPPQVEMPAHAADLGLDVLHGQDVPGEVPGRHLRRPQHGSWNRTKPIGARVDVHVSLKADGHGRQDGGVRRGWLDDATGTYRGRPVDVAVMKDGSLLCRDDFAGAIYSITYSAR